MMKKLKIFILFILTAAALFSLASCIGNTSGEQPVPVAKISAITGMSGGLVSRYAGVVEAPDTLEVKFDRNRALGVCGVAVGDEVYVGQLLFSYDTDKQALELEQKKLDIDRADSAMKQTQNTIDDIKKLLARAATDAARLEYSLQIQSLELQQRQSEYDLKLKKIECDKISESINNSSVYADMAGVIQAINDPYNPPPDQYGNVTDAYIIILAAGEYKLKGQINEQNISSLNEGSRVIVRSRTDSEKIWTGVIDVIDYANPISDQNGGIMFAYAGDAAGLTTSTKYPFYVRLDDSAGLILGQHVFIEPDIGDADKSAVWLMDYYIIDDGKKAFVWAAGKNDRLEKREVSLGAYDEALGRYEILKGLAPEDEIAWPEERLKAGLPVTRDGFIDQGNPNDIIINPGFGIETENENENGDSDLTPPENNFPGKADVPDLILR